MDGLDEVKKVMQDVKDVTLIQGISYVLENNEPKQAVRIVLVSLFGALLAKGESELADKMIQFSEEV